MAKPGLVWSGLPPSGLRVAYDVVCALHHPDPIRRWCTDLLTLQRPKTKNQQHNSDTPTPFSELRMNQNDCRLESGQCTVSRGDYFRLGFKPRSTSTRLDPARESVWTGHKSADFLPLDARKIVYNTSVLISSSIFYYFYPRLGPDSIIVDCWASH